MMEFEQIPEHLAGEPVWGAAFYPWTFVITQNGARYMASANNSSAPVQPARTNLGADFATLDDAKHACRVFLRSHLQ
jgi:hypothetical protein